MTTENPKNNCALLNNPIFAGLALLLWLMCLFSLCECAGRQQHVAADAPAIVADVETIEAMLSATLPSPDDPEAWNHGLGLVISVVALNMDTGRMVDVGISLFANFGDDTNVTVSDELNANLRLIAELTTRVPDLQAVVILSFAESDPNDVNLRRAMVITQTLVSYGVDETTVIYHVTRSEQEEEYVIPEADVESPDLETNTL